MLWIIWNMWHNTFCLLGCRLGACSLLLSTLQMNMYHNKSSFVTTRAFILHILNLTKFVSYIIFYLSKKKHIKPNHVFSNNLNTPNLQEALFSAATFTSKIYLPFLLLDLFIFRDGSPFFYGLRLGGRFLLVII